MDATYAASQNTKSQEPPKNTGEIVNVAVVGTSGYSGLELIRVLLRHPQAKLRACFSTQNEFDWAGYLPSARSIPVLNVKEIDQWAGDLDTVFLATPFEASLELAPRLLKLGLKVIDLSGAFRLNSGADYPGWYGHEHTSPDLLSEAEYGLTPWAGPTSTAKLIANPGCYATAILMALLPLVKRNYVELDSIIIDAKSGASGAGRKPSENLLFTEVDGECLPYKIMKHQHLPEILQTLQKIGGKELDLTFTPHLLNIRRGILCSIYGRITPGVTIGELNAAFARDYSDYPLMEWGPLDAMETRANQARLSLKRIVGSPFCRVHYQLNGTRLHMFSLLDNLMKGAASQAVENFNRLQGLPLQRGLESLEAVL